MLTGTGFLGMENSHTDFPLRCTCAPRSAFFLLNMTRIQVAQTASQETQICITLLGKSILSAAKPGAAHSAGPSPSES